MDENVTVIALVVTAIATAVMAVFAAANYFRRKNSVTLVINVNQIAQNMANVLPKAPVEIGYTVSLEFLTQDIPLPTKRHKRLCYALYESGRAQFDAKPNNRRGIIEQAQREMATLGQNISSAERDVAESLGIVRAQLPKEENGKVAGDIGNLSVKAQLYARYKTIEVETLLSLERDLSKEIPITDYTEVKKRVAEGASLAQVRDDLPIPWQKILDIPCPMPESRAKPTKPVYVPVTLVTEDGVFKDDKAERDGEWIISDKLGIVHPYSDMVPHYKFRNFNSPPVLSGKRLVITWDAPPEWDTKFWSKGGYLDQVFLRTARGEDPWTLRRKQLRSRIQMTAMAISSTFFLISLLYFLAQRYG